MPTDLFDRDGALFAVLDDEGNLQLQDSGHLLGWLWGRHLFTFAGERVATWRDGWLRDADGHALAFAAEAVGGPARPAPEEVRSRKAPPVSPKRPARGPVPEDPEPSDAWSPVPAGDFVRCTLDADGAPLPPGDAARRFASRRDRLLKQAARSVEEEEPEQTTAVSPPPTLRSGELDALNRALVAYRRLIDGDPHALAMARVDLHAAIERFAICSEDELS